MSAAPPSSKRQRRATDAAADDDDGGGAGVPAPPRAGAGAGAGASAVVGSGSGSGGGGSGSDDDDDGYVPYVTIKQRKAMEAAARKKKLAALRRATAAAAGVDASASESSDDDGPQPASKGGAEAAKTEEEKEAEAAQRLVEEERKRFVVDRHDVSLLDQMREAAAKGDVLTEKEQMVAEEEDILKQVTDVQKPALMSAKEHAEGKRYTESLVTDWRPPAHVRALTEEQSNALRDKWHILVEGDDVPPPVKSFKDMKFPQPVLDALAAKGIKRPTPIQVQGLPAVLSGRDMIGIAFTGSGKTMVFVLPMVMWALQEEMRLPLVSGEGPIGIILSPARELAVQTYENVLHFTEHLKRGGYPELRTMLCIGGEDVRKQMEPVNNGGVHMVVATLGRLNDHLMKGRINLDNCRFVCLDEADRLLDTGFDEEVQKMFTYFKQQRQTLLFSATMPKKILDFAEETLVKPVVVNVGRAGAANLDVIQEVEYVKQDAKVLYLLECLQKTAPPVLIFSQFKKDVDEIHEYLLLKGVRAVSIHGGKEQAERTDAIAQFKAGTKDVLIATDVAAKGLDFPDIQHVINFDMPPEIENYVHRIGRTGRCGKTGVATTFINRSVEDTTLLDLKHLLLEAQQRVPPVLMAMEDPEDLYRGKDNKSLGQGCSNCGGFGHRITNCPKLARDVKKSQGATRDYLAGGGDW